VMKQIKKYHRIVLLPGDGIQFRSSKIKQIIISFLPQ
jgi:hypothetical protein